MAHLTFARISGLAGRKKDLVLKFHRHTNVIFGVNGVGKTTLLKILHSAMSCEPGIVVGLPFTHAEVGVFSIDADREIVRELRNEPANDKGGGESVVWIHDSAGRVIRQRAAHGIPDWKVKARSADGFDDSALAHEYLPTTRLISMADMASVRTRGGEGSDEAQINSMMETQLQAQWVKYFSPLQARIQEAQQRGIARILSTVLSPGSAAPQQSELAPEMAYELAKKFLASHSQMRVPGNRATFIKRYQQEDGLAAVINEIASIESEASVLRRPKDQLQDLLNKLFLNKQIDLSSGNIRVALNAGGDKKLLKLSQLSSGEKQALYILIHALRAERNSLIVDEPELSMHIDWQRQLIDSIHMLNPSTQMLMATHSPEIMATVPDERIFEI